MSNNRLFEIYESEFQFAPTDQKIDSFMEYPYGKLGTILAATQALALIAQTCHWSAKGKDFYESHLLYERVYHTVNQFVDSLAERAVGLSKSGGIVNPIGLLKAQMVFVEELNGIGQEEYDFRLLSAIKTYKKLVTKCYEDIKSNQLLTPGLDNLLQGVLDKTEEIEYLMERTQAGMMG